MPHLIGADGSQRKDRKKREYQVNQHDVLVASEAAAVGANLQLGKWLVQYDTLETAMLHERGGGREQGRSGCHAAQGKCPRRELNFLLLARGVREHLVDAGKLRARVQIVGRPGHCRPQVCGS